jgi:hypothetical protein
VKYLISILCFCTTSLFGQAFYYGGTVGYGSQPNNVKYVWSTFIGSNLTPKKKTSPYVGVQLLQYTPSNNIQFVPQAQVGVTRLGFTTYYGLSQNINDHSVGMSFNAAYQLFRVEYIYNQRIVMFGAGYRIWN